MASGAPKNHDLFSHLSQIPFTHFMPRTPPSKDQKCEDVLSRVLSKFCSDLWCSTLRRDRCDVDYCLASRRVKEGRGITLKLQCYIASFPRKQRRENGQQRDLNIIRMFTYCNKTMKRRSGLWRLAPNFASEAEQEHRFTSNEQMKKKENSQANRHCNKSSCERS